MAELMADYARARGAGAWVSASPRVQRLAAASVAASLGAALVVAALHQRPAPDGEPLALAAATGPVAAPVAVVSDPPPSPSEPVAAVRTRQAPARQKRPQAASDPAWTYWAARIRGCESHGRPDAPADYKARNPQSSASGAYQILDATWAGRYGVSHAADASPSQQDAVAAELYRRHGTVDWAASAACWRR